MQARTTYREKALRYDGTASGGTVNTYTWNARNQLTQISQGGNAQLSFSYDALGRRMSKTVQGTATQFLYDGNNAVQETQGSTINPVLVGLGIDERFARNDVTGRTYFLVDQLNSTIALTDPSGVLKQQYSYDPYGNVTPSDTTTGFTNPYQYTGREADSPGLYYYRARYYSPQLLGFISEDPITFGGGQLSFYAYVNGNPLSNVDRLGLAGGAEEGDPAEEEAFRELMNPKLGQNMADPANQNIVQEQLEDGECYATGFRGSRGAPFTNTIFQPRRNLPETIDGVDYSGHALDQMQNRGIMPSIVRNALSTGEPYETGIGTNGYYDPVNNVRVITSSQTGLVVTVIPGAPSGWK